MELSTFEIFGSRVEIEAAPGVFMPSAHGLFYSRSIHVAPGERVVDIGTGSGVLAIAASRRGAAVHATDVDARAVAAAERNARRNRVEIDVRQGPLFADLPGPFDVILANLPNEIVAPAHLSRTRPEDARTFAGGNAGNEQLLALLASATGFMSPGARLYLAVHSLTDYHATLRAALRDYSARLLDLEALPVKPFVTENLAFYQALDEAGVIQIFRDAGGQWFSYAYVYELGLPPAPGRASNDGA
jgi:methylase of polypeptide subunit release factors